MLRRTYVARLLPSHDEIREDTASCIFLNVHIQHESDVPLLYRNYKSLLQLKRIFFPTELYIQSRSKDPTRSLGDVVSEDQTTANTELKGFGTTFRWSNLVFCTGTCPVGPKEKQRQCRCEK
jgi:hypothetical protein